MLVVSCVVVFFFFPSGISMVYWRTSTDILDRKIFSWIEVWVPKRACVQLLLDLQALFMVPVPKHVPSLLSLCYWLLRITACLLYGSHKSKHSVSRALGPPSLCWSHCPGAPELLCAAGWACLPAITEGLKWHREMHQHLSNPRTKWPRLPGSLSTTWEISKSPLGSVIRWDGKGSISTALQAGTDVQILEIFFLHSSG